MSERKQKNQARAPHGLAKLGKFSLLYLCPVQRWVYRFHAFMQALSRLQEAALSPLSSDLEKEGLCHRFEFTIELAWKVIKDYLEFAGYTFPLSSPRQVLITAGQVGLVQEVESWLELLALRNRLAHLYDRALLEEAVGIIQQKALPLFLFSASPAAA